MTWIDFTNLLINGLIEGLVVALPALAMTLVMGVNRFPNAATGDLMTTGAYAAVAVQLLGGVPLWLAAIASVGVTAVVSAGSYQLIFRKLAGRPMVASMLAAIGLGFLLRSLISFFAGHDQRTFELPLVRAWNFGGIRILPTDLLIAAIAAACLAVVFVLIYRTSFGRQLRAVADSADLARASGIRAGGLMLCLWLLVGALSSIGGVLLGMKAIVTPEMGWESLIPAFAAMVLGGIGSPVGAVLGALVLCVVQELSVPLLGPSYKLVLSFVVLALVLLLRPAGIMGRVQLVR
ncbi:branched-chain amino acid ABC transporter permease [Paracidovorax avenae]|uniref:branched-chain amino acid ABC transporter permease n=1 Tax=Paracidovorax avenae TaxID=80867 RepID=UPI000D171E46|nr:MULTISPECIES: branched-chain amino acid ABC transporter permease [Comamonadaceae]AVS61580.1 branched-chain amino acid ABC transporter permease [Paracidovorax avenae]MDA8452128.1 branched-chain amino acid ABC transporter permease [Acidovorax sp. GBBC 3297]MDA8461574.1 branched-chain amino acid ABC transporter permease [Acidovorax sp. GBBC 3333]MDA8466650.1 branched-chain amino acid ABC transporter permease [Acidovorax sp. GBBC 3332]MDA8471643.1 branched-chain amino acid ABC transporter perme